MNVDLGTLFLVLVISHLAVAVLSMAFGRIQGAEQVRAGLEGEVTRRQCLTCLKDVDDCRCPMAARRGSA